MSLWRNLLYTETCTCELYLLSKALDTLWDERPDTNTTQHPAEAKPHGFLLHSRAINASKTKEMISLNWVQFHLPPLSSIRCKTDWGFIARTIILMCSGFAPTLHHAYCPPPLLHAQSRSPALCDAGNKGEVPSIQPSVSPWLERTHRPQLKLIHVLHRQNTRVG